MLKRIQETAVNSLLPKHMVKSFSNFTAQVTFPYYIFFKIR